jgi:hypothetical protein
VPLTTAYHATPRKNWPRIKSEGLLPGDPGEGRATTGQRFDCEGYIFVCRGLGTPKDAGRPFAYSAHWWRDHLTGASGDPDWVILRIARLDEIPDLVTNRDVCSDSGVILSGIDRIPPDCLALEWPAIADTSGDR